jgi:hypothetical protein
MSSSYPFLGLAIYYFPEVSPYERSRDNSVGIATGYGPEFESRYDKEFFLLQVVQTGSGVHPTSYPMGTGGSFPGGKA